MEGKVHKLPEERSVEIELGLSSYDLVMLVLLVSCMISLLNSDKGSRCDESFICAELFVAVMENVKRTSP